MLKSQLVEVLAVRLGITSSDSERYLNSLIELIYEELKKDGVVKISGFGMFSVSHREARGGVDPRRPSKKITIPKLNTPKFKAGEAFKEAVALK
jgi:DNA-binding protein HU-beta